MTLQVIWFILVGVLLTVYAVLDGFDLGVGVLHPFIAKNETERRTLLAAVGPFWDGNEVWLLTGGGALFAAFPALYATVFSGLYLAMMLVLLGLILRVVSIEFRNRVESAPWRAVWDWGFMIGSLLPALLFGVAVGNLVRGVPLNADFDFAGTFLSLLNPYALGAGVLGLAMFVVHGALYITLKTDGPLVKRAWGVAVAAWYVFALLWVVLTIVTALTLPERFGNLMAMPVVWLVPLFTLAAMASTFRALRKQQAGRGFIASAATIVGLMGVFAVSLFPKMLPASNDPGLSLTAFNASSSQLTLQIMLIMVAIGLPLVIAYTCYIYRIFGGKVQLSEEGY